LLKPLEHCEVLINPFSSTIDSAETFIDRSAFDSIPLGRSTQKNRAFYAFCWILVYEEKKRDFEVLSGF
jgi:hypothetical protein